VEDGLDSGIESQSEGQLDSETESKFEVEVEVDFVGLYSENLHTVVYLNPLHWFPLNH
jgi:hypothetical protein